MARSSRDLALRTHPLLLAVMLFLASELMFFAGMLTAYFNLRMQTPVWPPADVHLDLVESSIGTALLALSSGSMLLTTHSLSRGRFTAARVSLGATILLGIAFLAITVHGWTDDTFRVNTHAYGSVFFMLTGFHAMHVLVGVLLMTLWFIAMRQPAFERDERAGGESVGLYWHFVFGVWLLIWGTIYLIR
jgi:cytochrome c oxidase subunit 3